MNQETKIECYRKAYQTLKQMAGVRNLGYPEEKKDLEFFCDIGRFHVSYNLRLNRDFITIRAGKVYQGKSDEELDQIGRELSEGQSFYFTGYDQKLYLQLSLPMAGIADEDARKRIDEETVKFFQFLMETEGVSMEKTGEETEEEAGTEEQEEENESGVFPGPGQEDDSFSVEKAAPGINKDESRKMELEWIAKLQKENAEKSEALDDRESGLTDRERRLDTEKAEVEQLRKEMSQKDEQILARLQEAEKKEEENASVSAALLKREEAAAALEKEYQEKRQILDSKEKRLQNETADLEKRKAKEIARLQSKETELNQQELQISTRDANLSEREQMLKEKSGILEEKEQMLSEKGKTLEEKEQDIKKTLAQMEQEDQRLTERSRELDKQEEKVNQKLQETGTIAELKKNLTQQIEAKTQELEQEKTAHEKAVCVLKEEKATLSNEIERVKDSFKKAQERLNQVREEKAAVSRDLSELQKQEQQTRLELEETVRKLSKVTEAKEQEKRLYDDQISSYQNTVRNQEQEITKIQEEFRLAKKDLRKAEDETSDLRQELERQKEKEKRLRHSLTQKDAEQDQERELLSNLQDQLEEYKRQMQHIGTPEEVLKDFAETRKENRMLKREIQDMEMEAKMNEKALLDQIQSLQNQQETAAQDAIKQEEEQLPENQAERIIGELKTSGITMSVETYEDHLYLRGTKEGCVILFDVENRIVSVEKELRKAFKYSEEVAKWNSEDMTESYILQKDRVICRKLVHDITMDVNKVLRKILILK